MFGPFKPGHYELVEDYAKYVRTREPKIPNIRGRQTDMFRVIDKILNSKGSRLFNLIGWAGVGKSALAVSMLNYISERNLFSGGTIYINARNHTMYLRFTHYLNKELITENPKLFSHLKDDLDE